MLWITLWNGMFSVTISLWIIITCLVILFFSQAVRTYNRSEYGLTSQRLYHGLQYFCGGSESSLALCSRTTRYSCVYGSKYSNEAQVSIACSNTGTQRERERESNSFIYMYLLGVEHVWYKYTMKFDYYEGRKTDGNIDTNNSCI